MIKPATLWSHFKTCPNSQWLGDICRALGGQDVELDFGQQQVYNAIKNDSDWMDERIEWERERHRRNMAAHRARQSQKVTVTQYSDHQDTDVENVTYKDERDGHVSDVTDVTVTPLRDRHVTPSLPPSLPPSVQDNISGGGGNSRTPARTRVKKTPICREKPKSADDAINILCDLGINTYDRETVIATLMELKRNGWKDADGKPVRDWVKYLRAVADKSSVAKFERECG